MIRITAKRDGFRRGGIAHPTAPTDYPDDHFTANELEQIRAEPLLVVEVIANPKPSGKSKDKDKPADPPADKNTAEDQAAPAGPAAAAEEDKGAK